MKSRTRLRDFTFTFHFHALEKEMKTHSSVLAWRIPGTGEPGGLPSMGSHRVRHDWSDLAAVAWWFKWLIKRNKCSVRLLEKRNPKVANCTGFSRQEYWSGLPCGTSLKELFPVEFVFLDIEDEKNRVWNWACSHEQFLKFQAGWELILQVENPLFVSFLFLLTRGWVEIQKFDFWVSWMKLPL